MAAASKSANLEAINQFRRGLSLVEALSDMRKRAERELDLANGAWSGSVRDQARQRPDTDIGRAYARAWELCQQLGDHSRGFTALRGLQFYHMSLLEMEKALHFAEEALRVAERLGDAARLVGAHMALAGAGTVSEAKAAVQQGIEVACRQNAKSWELPCAMSLAHLRRQQGRPQEAVPLLAPILGWFTEDFDITDLQSARTLLADLQNPAAIEPVLVRS